MLYKNVHGGDIYSKNNIKYIDFSANINPLGIPENVKHAFIESIDSCIYYPDIFCRKLRKAISKYEDVEYNYIVCSNGAADLIYRICYSLNPKKALLLSPTFSEYESALKNVNCDINYYNLYEKNNFEIKENIVNYISKADIVFICNPNNPTGRITEKNIILKILDEALKYNAVVVIDECFNDFVDNNINYTLKDNISKYENLIIIKAFTKIFALPGIRLGYCLTSNMKILEGLYHAGPPWSVSCVAQNCGIACLENSEYIEKTKELIRNERIFLKEELKKIGFKVFEPFANYIFFKSSFHINLKDKLDEKGILVRSCENYRGLDKTFYRIAVKKRNENEILLSFLKDIL